MHKHWNIIVSLFLLARALSGTALAKTCLQLPCVEEEPLNIGILKKEVIAYMKSGNYLEDIAKVARQAQKYLQSRLPLPKNSAVVFDVDDTLISNWYFNIINDFGYNHKRASIWEESAQAPALRPLLNLYTFCKDHGIKIIFITGRRAFLKQATQANLKKVGYDSWDALIFRPDSYTITSRIPFKTAVRRLLEERYGLTIVANIGDQYSDLLGGYSNATFKLPNPMYFIP